MAIMTKKQDEDKQELVLGTGAAGDPQNPAARPVSHFVSATLEPLDTTSTAKVEKEAEK